MPYVAIAMACTASIIVILSMVGHRVDMVRCILEDIKDQLHEIIRLKKRQSSQEGGSKGPTT